MTARKIQAFLDRSKVQYVVITHPRTFTAQEAAESTHICGQLIAKTVIVWLDGRLVMAAVPATKSVDLALLKYAKGADYAWLAEEDDFKDRFVGCQRGAVPPLGNLFALETICDPSLAHNEYICFTAGTYTDVIVMKFADYDRLVRPTLIRIATETVGVGLRAGSL